MVQCPTMTCAHSARPSFKCCLMRECLWKALTVIGAAGDDLRLRHAVEFPGRPPRGGPAKISFHTVRIADVEIVSGQRFEEAARVRLRSPVNKTFRRYEQDQSLLMPPSLHN